MTKIQKLLPILILCFIAIGCQFVESIINPIKPERNELTLKEYLKDGLSFSYPDNWSVNDDKKMENGVRFVTFEDNYNSVFMVTGFPSKFSINLEDYVKKFNEESFELVPIGKVTIVEELDVTRTIKNSEQQGKRLRYSITLLGETVPHISDFFKLEGDELTTIVVMQTATENRNGAEKEFQVMLDSLKFD